MPSKFLCFIAGVDHQTLEKCTPSDKIWATHVGAMLLFTFCVIASVTYLSFDYLGSIATTINPETNKVSYTQVENPWSSVFIGILLATVIALIISFFDRAIFISDWFFQPTYGQAPKPDIWRSFFGWLFTTAILLASLYYFQTTRNPDYSLISETLTKALGYTIFAACVLAFLAVIINHFISIKRWNGKEGHYLPIPEPTFVQRLSRVLIRFTISLFIAFSLSTFLELRVYETNIFAKLSEWHFERNKDLYAAYESRVEAITASIDPFVKSVADAQVSVDSLNQATSGDITAALKSIDDQIENLRKEYMNDDAALLQDRDRARAPTVEALTEAQAQLVKAQEEKTYYERRIGDEVGGTNDLGDANASGVAGAGDLAEAARIQAAALGENVKVWQAEVDRLTKELKQIDALYQQRIDTRRTTYEDQRVSLLEDKKAVSASRSTSSEELELQLASAQSRLKLANDALEAARNSQVADLASAKRELLENPQFKPFQAGPLERLEALQAIKNGEEFGAVISQYAVILKLFVIFLEVIPVVTKMFFSPPSLYATTLQVEMYILSREKIEGVSKRLSGFRSRLLDEMSLFFHRYGDMARQINDASLRQAELIKSLKLNIDNLHAQEIKLATSMEFHDEHIRSIIKELINDFFAKSKP